jgi:ketosteroid isomerase-like protein
LAHVGNRHDVIRAAYRAFNERDLDAALELLHPDVDWPNAWEGDRVVGRAAVRAYWLRQWEVLDPEVHPRRVRELPDGRAEVLVHQVVRDREGDLLGETLVLHTYTFAGDLVSRMDVGDPAS